jgi:hypothetical protein
VKSRIYVLDFQTQHQCKSQLTLKKSVGKIKRFIAKKLKILEYLKKYQIFSKRLPRKKSSIKTILENMNTTTKYTYCLNNDTLIFAETTTTKDRAILKDWLSKHVILCGDNACSSGEMVVHNNELIFDNNSGSYKPTSEHLESLISLLSFLPIKIVPIHSEEHHKYFSKYKFLGEI